MFFKIGKVISRSKNYIIFESNYTGYVIYVANVEDFAINKVLRIYTYIHRNEFTETYYGFKKFEERILFDDLMTIPGVGPKSAITILKNGSENIIQAIINENLDFIKSIPYIGQKTASMIVFELKSKYEKYKNKIDHKHMPIELSNTLKTLGFKKEQIDYAIKNLKPNASIEALVEEAIKIISEWKRT